MFYRFCFLLCFVLTQLAGFGQSKKFTVTAYYAGSAAQIDSVNPTKLTHIIFSFCHLKGNRLNVDNLRDTVRIQKLVALKKKAPALKVLLSLGGWGGCASCSGVFSTDAGRKEFAASVKELNAFFGTNGIDLDWEYPAIAGYPGHLFQPADKQNFTALVADLRNSLGAKNEISFAAGGFQKFVDEAIDWEKVIPLVDRVNLMTYDLVGGYATTTGHHTPLYSTAAQTESADNAINRLLQRGVPASKLVIGAAFYGRMWENVSATNNGLYQSGKFKAYVPYKNFATSFAEQEGYTYYRDSIAKAPYIYNSQKKLFVTFDDKQSLAEKTAYALSKGLNGIMFWELSHDVAEDSLLEAIRQATTVN